MKFQDFGKNLSNEIENLFATIGDSRMPENTQRLDKSFSIEDMLERVKHLDLEEMQAETKAEKGNG